MTHIKIKSTQYASNTEIYITEWYQIFLNIEDYVHKQYYENIV